MPLTVTVGDMAPLALQLGNAGTGLFPRAIVLDDVGSAIPIATLDLTEVDSVGLPGYYFVAWDTTGETLGNYTIRYAVFTDAGYTILSSIHDLAAESVLVTLDPVTGNGNVRQGFTYVASSNQIIVNTQLEVANQAVQSNVNNAKITLHNAAGVVLIATLTDPTPDAQGVFQFTVPSPLFALGETATYSVATVDHLGPPVRTYRSVQFVTFSRVTP